MGSFFVLCYDLCALCQADVNMEKEMKKKKEEN